MGKRRDGTRLTRSLLSLLTPCLVSLRLFPGSLRSPLTPSLTSHSIFDPLRGCDVTGSERKEKIPREGEFTLRTDP